MTNEALIHSLVSGCRHSGFSQKLLLHFRDFRHPWRSRRNDGNGINQSFPKFHISSVVIPLMMMFSTGIGAQGVASEITLGKALFADKNLSADRSVACASCHQPDHGFADTRAVSLGVHGQPGTRNAPSLLDIGEYQSFFWDGRAATLRQQASVPFLAANELGFANIGQVLARVQENPRYLQAFQALHGGVHHSLQFSDIAGALMAYERSLVPSPNALDKYQAGDKTALSLSARHGLELFQNKADCASCHQMTASAAPLTDNQFHSSGVGLAAIGPDLAGLAKDAARQTPEERFQRIESEPKLATLGRYLVTLDPKDIGEFRTPSLRNVALTAPYMHDGSVKTLDQAVDIELYYRSLALGHPVILTPAEKQDLLAFLRSLSSLAEQKIALAAGRVIDTAAGRVQPGAGGHT